ncbi:MAG TPA: M20/M25/M40 family metallo-hydrolase, partial [Chloroflexota bacterium]
MAGWLGRPEAMAVTLDSTRRNDLATAIQEAIVRQQGQLMALCGDLIQAPSINPPGDTTGPVRLVQRFLAERGASSRLVSRATRMPNLVATCEGVQPGPHLVLNVHLDTMEPGDEAAWSVPVLQPTRRDGRLYGLGIGNMKGAVAAMAMAFVELSARRADWPGRITLAAVADEVVFGQNGAAYLLEREPELAGDGLLCGEGPGGLNLAIGEKGLLWLELEGTDAGGHASAVHRGQSAVARLCQAVLAVDALNQRDTAPPAALRSALPVGHPARQLTANAGVLAAGTVPNQIARTARATVDLRVPPGVTLDELQMEIDTIVSPLGVVSRRAKGWEANWTDPGALLPRVVREAATRVRGKAPEDVVRLPASDASRWRALGIPAVCY